MVFFKNTLNVKIVSLLKYFLYRFLKGGKFALNNLDKKLEKYLNYQNGFFIELGANDGITQSNTFYLEKRKKWGGILIEPSPNHFESIAYFRGKKHNKIFSCACVPFDFKEKYVDIEYVNLMSFSANLDIDLIDKKKHMTNTKEKIQFGALGRTITSILDESLAPKEIDFISLDVEGAELDVLKGFDFNRYSFKYLLVESKNIDRVEVYLKEKNYFLKEKLTHHDYLFSK